MSSSLSINELEAKKTELQKATTELKQHLAELQENNAYNLNLEVKQDGLSLSGGGSSTILVTAELFHANQLL